MRRADPDAADRRDLAHRAIERVDECLLCRRRKLRARFHQHEMADRHASVLVVAPLSRWCAAGPARHERLAIRIAPPLRTAAGQGGTAGRRPVSVSTVAARGRPPGRLLFQGLPCVPWPTGRVVGPARPPRTHRPVVASTVDRPAERRSLVCRARADRAAACRRLNPAAHRACRSTASAAHEVRSVSSATADRLAVTGASATGDCRAVFPPRADRHLAGPTVGRFPVHGRWPPDPNVAGR